MPAGDVKSRVATVVKPGRSTRQLLLDVATRQFAENGYDGARVDQIVEECQVSKNLLYHYFESKEALFVAVMEQAYTMMRRHQSEWSFSNLEPAEAIARLVGYTFDHFLEQPAVISLLNTGKPPQGAPYLAIKRHPRTLQSIARYNSGSYRAWPAK